MWSKEVLTPAGLTNILENYAQIVEEKDPRTGKKKRKQVWPRYHQLSLVRQALADVRAHGAGKRYLILPCPEWSLLTIRRSEYGVT